MIYVDWNYLKGLVTLEDDWFHFKGKLSSNPMEKDIYATPRSIDYSLLMCQLFDMRGRNYSSWAKEHWLCIDCVTDLFTDTLPLWWLDRKRKGKLSSRI